MDKSDKVSIHIGIGDSFTYKREHWVIVDIRADEFVCKNKDTGAVVKFGKDVIKKIIN